MLIYLTQQVASLTRLRLTHSLSSGSSGGGSCSDDACSLTHATVNLASPRLRLLLRAVDFSVLVATLHEFLVGRVQTTATEIPTQYSLKTLLGVARNVTQRLLHYRCTELWHESLVVSK
jgi:hypothetical protein